MLALRRYAAVLVLFPVGYLVLFHGLGRYGAVNGDEAFYHVVAATMVETGDYLRLDFYGEHRIYDTFMNAPLHYWTRALAIGALGDGPLAMRMQSALFGLASVLLTAAMARRLAGARAAFLAAAVQLTTFQFIYWHGARTGELETATAFFMTAVAWSFVRYVETGRGLVLHHVCWLLLANWKLPEQPAHVAQHHVCWLLLANWKLPLGALPLLAEAAAFALLPAARARFAPWLRAAVLILPLGFVWHAGQLVAHWDGFREVVDRMLAQALEPVAGARQTGIGANLRFYAFAVLYGAFPYSLLYPFAFGSLLWAKEEGGRVRFIVLGLFVASVFVFFALVTKHHRWYWVPALPLLSILVAVWLDRVASGRGALSLVVAFAVLLAGVGVIDVDLLRGNPFAGRTVTQPIVIPMRSFLGAPPLTAALGIASTACLFAALLRFTGRRTGPLLASFVLMLSLGLATIRVLAPLQHLDHRSEMARVRDRIDAVRATGGEPELPIPLREGGELKVRALFARDFEIVVGRPPVSFWLLAPGDPRAERSIRRGLPDDWPNGS